MRTFVDGVGRVWGPRLSLPAIRFFMDRTGITLRDIAAAISDGMKLLEKRAGKGLDLAALLDGDWASGKLKVANLMLLPWATCQAEARKRGIGQEEFEEGIGVAELKGCLAAIWGAAVEAFPSVGLDGSGGSAGSAGGEGVRVKGEDQVPLG